MLLLSQVNFYWSLWHSSDVFVQCRCVEIPLPTILDARSLTRTQTILMMSVVTWRSEKMLVNEWSPQHDNTKFNHRRCIRNELVFGERIKIFVRYYFPANGHCTRMARFRDSSFLRSQSDRQFGISYCCVDRPPAKSRSNPKIIACNRFSPDNSTAEGAKGDSLRPYPHCCIYCGPVSVLHKSTDSDRADALRWVIWRYINRRWM